MFIMGEPHMSRTTRLVTGAGLAVAGLAMLVLPGPGILTLLAAARLVAPEVPAARRLTDRVEAWLRPSEPTPA